MSKGFRLVTWSDKARIQVNRFDRFESVLKYSYEYNRAQKLPLQGNNYKEGYSQLKSFQESVNKIDEIKENVDSEIAKLEQNSNIEYHNITSSWVRYIIYDKKNKTLLIEHLDFKRPALLYDVEQQDVDASVNAPSFGQFYLRGGFGYDGKNKTFDVGEIPGVGFQQFVDFLSGKITFETILFRMTKYVNPFSVVRLGSKRIVREISPGRLAKKKASGLPKRYSNSFVNKLN